MFAPIRPRPTIPICMLSPSSMRLALGLRCERLVDRRAECLQAFLQVTFQVHAHAAAITFVERLKIAKCLRCDERTEPDVHSGNRQIECSVRGDLYEYAGVGAAFVFL